MAPRQGNQKAPAAMNAAGREGKIFRLARSIIDPKSPVRVKSLMNRDIRNEACIWRGPLGLTLLQIAVIADNVPAGALQVSLDVHHNGLCV